MGDSPNFYLTELFIFLLVNMTKKKSAGEKQERRMHWDQRCSSGIIVWTMRPPDFKAPVQEPQTE